MASALTELIASNSQNGSVFRVSGGVSTAIALAKTPASRNEGICLLQHLVLASGSEDDMTVLLELLQSCNDFESRTAFVLAIVSCLRDSHRCRTIFRKAGGFVYLVSVLLSLDRSLSSLRPDCEAVLTLLRSVFYCLTVAMRYEPANARYFEVEIATAGNNLVEAIQLLGCFSTLPQHSILHSDLNSSPNESLVELFRKVFSSDLKEALLIREDIFKSHSTLSPTLFFASLVLRMLYDMAIDGYERSNVTITNSRSPRQSETELSVAGNLTTIHFLAIFSFKVLSLRKKCSLEPP